MVDWEAVWSNFRGWYNEHHNEPIPWLDIEKKIEEFVEANTKKEE